MVTAVALPLMVLAAAVIYDSYRGDRLRAEERLREQAGALARLVDREFDRVEAVLRTLAASDALADGNFTGFDHEIRAASQSLRGEPIALLDVDNHQLLSTAWPIGDRRTDRYGPEQLRGVVRTGQTVITDLYTGANSGKPVVTMGVPVFANSAGAADPSTPRQVQYVLAAGTPSSILANLLAGQHLRPGWVAGVVDRSHHVAARTAEPEKYVGSQTLPRVLNAMLANDTGVVRGPRVDGVEASTVFARAPVSGFFVALAVPSDEFEAPLRFALWRTLILGLIISGVGLGLAFRMARRLAVSIQDLARPGHIPDRSLRLTNPRAARVREVEIVGARLARIAAERDSATAALRELAERLEQQVSDRTEALAESEARLRAIFDAQFQYITLLDPDGRRLEMNRSALAFGGVPTEQMLGTRIWEAPWWRDDDDAIARIKTAVARAAAGEPTRLEVQATGVDGTPSILDMSVRPVYDRVTGSVRMLIGEGHDITELRALERRVAQTSRLEALGQLAGGVAHDFNNVMQAISGAMSMIARRAEDAATVRRLAGMVTEAIERGAAVTSRLLGFARRDALSASPVDVGDLLNNLQEVLSHTLGAAIRVVVEVPPDLPPLLADRSQLETVLVNLATNARDAMPTGGVLRFTAGIELISAADTGPLTPGQYIRLATADTGQGMDPATLARAVEPFFTTKSPGQGTGLGLAMARVFAERSSGAMQIESIPKNGTTVTLWLPEADAVVSPPHPPAMLPPDRRRLMIVEDGEMLREMLAASLEAHGYLVTQAADPVDALALLAESGPDVDLLISDLSMPGMNGLDLIRHAQKLRPELPAILLTGFVGDTASAAVREALRGNRFALLHKPVSERQLTDRVAALLERSEVMGVG